MQRLHIDDLAGYVLKQQGWTYLNFPAIAEATQKIETGDGQYYERREGELLHPARENEVILDSLKAQMGSQAFSAQYQQQSVPLGGNMIKWKWFQTYQAMPSTKNYRAKIIQSWDTASKSGELNDYSVGITAILEDDCFYIIDVIREKFDYPDLKCRIIDAKKIWNAETILIEDKGSGTSLIQDLKRENIRSIAVKPEGDKVTRMMACTAQIEAGEILLPQRASWPSGFKNELLAFPNGVHDDQVDALSQMINWNRNRSHYTLDNS